MIEKLIVKNVKRRVAETFEFELDRGWLRVVVDEGSGSLNIESDWGNASSCWPAQAGKLKAFLATMDNGYVDRALRGRTFMGHPMKMRVVDWEGAEKKLKKRILAIRRHGYTLDMGKEPEIRDADTARAYWDAVERWCSEHDRGMEDAWNCPDEVHELTEGEPWYFLEERDSHMAVFWSRNIIPAVMDFFRSSLDDLSSAA